MIKKILEAKHWFINAVIFCSLAIILKNLIFHHHNDLAGLRLFDIMLFFGFFYAFVKELNEYDKNNDEVLKNVNAKLGSNFSYVEICLNDKWSIVIISLHLLFLVGPFFLPEICFYLVLTLPFALSFYRVHSKNVRVFPEQGGD